MAGKKQFLKYAKDLNPIDDIMFCKMAEHKEFCEEILRVILEDEKLTVVESIPQWSGKSLQGRSVILDAKCVTGDGKQINIEIQKSDDDNHQKRVRYNGAILTTNVTDTGTKFEFVPDVCVVFISTFDIFGGCLPLYHVDRVVRETKQVIENGFAEIYVNSVHYDGSKAARLMRLFTENDIYDNKEFPVTSEIKAKYKTTDKGVKEMNGIMEKLLREEREEGEKLGEKRGIELGEKRGSENEKRKIAKDMKLKGFAENVIMELTGLSMDKIMTL